VSLLGVDLLVCEAVEGAPLYPVCLGNIHSGCLSPVSSLWGCAVRVC
jgi:hypothetical protein